MIECTDCGAQGESNFSTNYFGELVCELCGTQSFLQSRNETQDMEDTNLDVMKSSTMKRVSKRKAPRRVADGDISDALLRDDSGRNGTMRRGIGKRMKRRTGNATLLNCLRATQTVLDHQARALASLGGFPDEFVDVVEQLWFLFLETWELKSSKPLLRCFTEFFIPRGVADRAMDPAITQQLLEQWDADRAAEADAAEAARAAAALAATNDHNDDDDDATVPEPLEATAAEADVSTTATHGTKRRNQRRLPNPSGRKRASTTQAAVPSKTKLILRDYSASLDRFSILDLLGLLLLATRVLNLGVLPSDVAFWIATGALPFHNLLSVCSQELQIAVFDVSLFFESTVAAKRVTSARIAYHAHYLQHHLALPLPPLNVSLAAYAMCQALGFPPQVFRHVQWLTAHVSIKGAWLEPPLLRLTQRHVRGSTQSQDDALLATSVGIAAHVVVAVKLTANWHEWIYETPPTVDGMTPHALPTRLVDARRLPRHALDTFVDYCEQSLIGPDRANIPPAFESHVYDLRGKYSDISPDASSATRLTQSTLVAYPAQYVNGVCAEDDDAIEARVAALKKLANADDADGLEARHDSMDHDDVFFYPFYAPQVKFKVLHAAYEHVVALVSEYIDAPIAQVLAVTERLDQEVRGVCRAMETGAALAPTASAVASAKGARASAEAS